ncbi:hypothetical protein [Blattabacterium cuenoti]|uniref:hypothetical protein n=1 Tax=Blattabacterium cuenoti TaxID=1653831 RepID=UPI00163BF04F|nr:hypothetical protein [Blattabacterium cuenoti]
MGLKHIEKIPISAKNGDNVNPFQKDRNPDYVGLNDLVKVRIKTSKPIPFPFDFYNKDKR